MQHYCIQHRLYNFSIPLMCQEIMTRIELKNQLNLYSQHGV